MAVRRNPARLNYRLRAIVLTIQARGMKFLWEILYGFSLLWSQWVGIEEELRVTVSLPGALQGFCVWAVDPVMAISLSASLSAEREKKSSFLTIPRHTRWPWLWNFSILRLFLLSGVYYYWLVTGFTSVLKASFKAKLKFCYRLLTSAAVLNSCAVAQKFFFFTS